MEKRSVHPEGPAFSAIKGRGAQGNPQNRFEEIILEKDPESSDDDSNRKTVYYKETVKTAISFNDSPDVGMNVTFNPYRGCEHGCIYCYARPTLGNGDTNN